MDGVVSAKRVSKTEGEHALELMARAFAEARGLAFKVALMTDGPEPRISLGIHPSGRLRDVAVRLSYRSHSAVRAITQLSVVDAARWGDARAVTIYRLRSEAMLPWPIDQATLAAFLDCAVEQARLTTP
jgi:hypothetical protein